MLKQFIKQVVSGQNLTEEEAILAMTEIMEGRATDAQMGAFLTALHLKGETVDEITGFARVMRQKVTRVYSKHPQLIDTCGTGGDGTATFNISTTAALVLAGAGAKVAKHGNRSVSSRSGSADLLEALGVNLDLNPEQAGHCLDEVGICFLYAPRLHGAMKYAAQPRREIGIRTVFNILGPLTNPAATQAQVLGVYSADLVDKLAKVLAKLGSNRAFVLHGAGGLDELSGIGLAQICEVRTGEVYNYSFNPQYYGFQQCNLADLAGGEPEENAVITREILAGAAGPKRDAVVLNTALGLICAGLAEDINAGIKLANQSIDSGAAMEKLNELARYTTNLASEKVVSF